MNLKSIGIILITIVLFNCQNSEKKKNNITVEKSTLVPINYSFEKLGLKLNSSLSDSTNLGFWKWNHMASNNSQPDTLGIEYFQNLEQPRFEFDGQETLPALYALTDKGKIVEFSAIYIFNLSNQKEKTKHELFDKLNLIELLKDKKVRQEIIENGIYRRETDQVIETIELEISKEKYGYDSVTYEIKNATQHRV
jgi:hypothetical protein